MGGASIRTVGVSHEGAKHFLIELFHRVGLGVGYTPSQDLSCNALHGNKPKFFGNQNQNQNQNSVEETQ